MPIIHKTQIPWQSAGELTPHFMVKYLSTISSDVFFFQNIKFFIFSFSFRLFLALLDYVSRAHEIEILPLSVFHLWVSCGFSWAICPDLFFIFEKNFFFDFSGIFFVFVNMGPYRSQNFKMLLLPQITFESFQNFF